MEALRDMFRSIGFKNVKSYIASGNVAFDTRKAKDSTLINKIETAVKLNFSLEIEVLIRTISEIENVLDESPFEKQLLEDTNLYVVFLKESLSSEKVKQLTSHNNEFETFEVKDRNIYCLSKKGFIKSLLGKKYIDNKLKTPATARNWRTVNKIVDL